MLAEHPDDPRGAVHREKGIDLVGALFSVVGMGGIVLGILVWQEGGEAVAADGHRRHLARLLAWWLVGASGPARCPLDPDLFLSKIFRLGVTGQGLQQVSLGG